MKDLGDKAVTLIIRVSIIIVVTLTVLGLVIAALKL